MSPDGFRGAFGHDLVTPEAFYCLPHALYKVLGVSRIVVGHDPRPSSKVLIDSLISGAVDLGMEVLSAGVVPTPMLAKWAHTQGLLGLMVTASHNPAIDNGLKFISRIELTDSDCQNIRKYLEKKPYKSKKAGRLIDVHTTVQQAYFKALSDFRITHPVRCLFDTAHGAWHPHIKHLRAFGIDVHLKLPFQPERINTTGALHAHKYTQQSKQYDYIVCLDGDGDRLQLVKDGTVLDGDDILLMLAKLQKLPVVTTVMSNQRLIEVLESLSCPVKRVGVGDRLVRTKLEELGGRYGAEPCGHIIDLNWLPTSDPVYIFCLLLSSSNIVSLEDKYYQYHCVLPQTRDIQQLQQQLSLTGIRTVIRYSQTEPVIRVMLEGSQFEIERVLASVSMH